MAAQRMDVISAARWRSDICSGGVSLIGFMGCKRHLKYPEIMIQIFQDDGYGALAIGELLMDEDFLAPSFLKMPADKFSKSLHLFIQQEFQPDKLHHPVTQDGRGLSGCRVCHHRWRICQTQDVVEHRAVLAQGSNLDADGQNLRARRTEQCQKRLAAGQQPPSRRRTAHPRLC